MERERLVIEVPTDLSKRTKDLIARFAEQMAHKLYLVDVSKGLGDTWCSSDWEDDWRKSLHKHIEKGDAVDVANYCAFGWFWKWNTAHHHKDKK